MDNLYKYYPRLSEEERHNCNYLFNQIKNYKAIVEFENLFNKFNVNYEVYLKGTFKSTRNVKNK